MSVLGEDGRGRTLLGGKNALTESCYVIQVLAGRERIAQAELERIVQWEHLQDRCAVMVPLLEKIVLRDRYRREVIRETLFPGYLFVFGKLDHRLYDKMIRNRRVCRFLQVDQDLYELPRTEWKLLGDICNDEGVADLSEVDFDEQDRIVVRSGAMKNLVGNIVKVNKRKQFAVVEMMFLGRTVSISFNFKMLQKCNI